MLSNEPLNNEKNSKNFTSLSFIWIQFKRDNKFLFIKEIQQRHQKIFHFNFNAIIKVYTMSFIYTIPNPYNTFIHLSIHKDNIALFYKIEHSLSKNLLKTFIFSYVWKTTLLEEKFLFLWVEKSISSLQQAHHLESEVKLWWSTTYHFISTQKKKDIRV